MQDVPLRIGRLLLSHTALKFSLSSLLLCTALHFAMSPALPEVHYLSCGLKCEAQASLDAFSFELEHLVHCTLKILQRCGTAASCWLKPNLYSALASTVMTHVTVTHYSIYMDNSTHL